MGPHLVSAVPLARPRNYRPPDRGCHRLASTVFQRFVAADNASEAFAGLKRIHGMMPYFMLKAALKISNPVAMIRGEKLRVSWLQGAPLIK